MFDGSAWTTSRHSEPEIKVTNFQLFKLVVIGKLLLQKFVCPRADKVRNIHRHRSIHRRFCSILECWIGDGKISISRCHDLVWCGVHLPRIYLGGAGQRASILR